MNIDFFDIKIGVLTLDEIVNKVLEFAVAEKHGFITYFNAHCLNVSFNDQEYKKILKSADLVYAGGQGIVWASRFLGTPLPERVNILDFFDMLVPELKNKNITIYLLGGMEGVVRNTEVELEKKGLKIIGKRNGFFDEKEDKDIVREINTLKPDILIVGMGVPKQEKWIYEHLEELDVNLCWGVGAAFEWLSGYRKRAPKWMVDFGLEWLHRLYQEPIRLWKRYVFGNIIFIYHVINWRARHVKTI